jgi:O-antigen/teichoic acid export membrane protein
MSLKKDASIYLATNILNKTIPFLLLPFLTNYLRPEQFGMIEIFVLSAGFMDMLVCFSVDSAVGRAYFESSGKDQFAVYIGTAFLLVIINFLIVTSFIVIFQKQLFHLVKLPVEWLLLAPVFVLSKCVTLTNLILWRMEKKTVSYALYLIPYSIMDIVLSIALVVAIRDWPGRIIGMVATAIVFAVISQWVLRKRGYLKMLWNTSNARSILRYCMPLLPHNLSSWIKGSLDLFIIATFVGIEGVGIYGVSVTIGKGILLIVESFAQTWMPHVYSILSDGNSGKKRLVQQSYVYMLCLLVIAVIYIIIVPYVFPWFIGVEFLNALKFVPFLVVAHLFDGWYRVFVIYIFYSKKTEIISILTALTGVIHVPLLLILVKEFGLMGAAIAISFSSLITFLSVVWISNKVFPMPWNLLWTYAKPTR